MINTYFHPGRLAAIQHYANAQVAQNNFAGIAWSVEQHGLTVDEGRVGYMDHELSRPVQKDTLYRLYSMTKPVVSVRCLQLIESRKLRLDDPISRWIPEFRSMSVLDGKGALTPASRAITIEDLLMHRAGLSYDFMADCPVAEMYRDAQLAAQGGRSLKDLVGMLGDFPLALNPGERWYYSYATDVLAHVIECVSDQSIGETLQAALFSPLGMQDTGYSVAQEKQHRVADMFGLRDLCDVDNGEYDTNRLLPMNVDESYPLSSNNEFGRGGIGLFSSMADYRKFMAVLMHGHSESGEPLLSKPMLDMLWQNRLTNEQMPIAIGQNVFAGYGWGLTGRVMVDTSAAGSVCSPGEGGWAGAASTYFWVDRANGISGLILGQYLGSTVSMGPEMQGFAYSALCQQNS